MSADAVPTWPVMLGALLRGEELRPDDTAWAMARVMSGEATAAQISAFAVLLRAKGETAGEVAGLARTMLEFALPVTVEGPLLDIVGSGGDRSHTVNISTMAAIVAAAAGARVAKHGNRAASSACGAADLLEELGVAIDLGADGVAACVTNVGIGFCFAPVFHPGYRHAGPVRREIGVPTAFNFLGPLTNPARAVAVAVGCADGRMAAVTAHVLAGRGARGLVFRGDDGLDELTTTTTSRVWVVTPGAVAETVLDPVALDLPRATPDQLRGGDASANAAVARDLLAGKAGPVRDAVLLNAAAGLVAWDEPDVARLTDQLRDALVQGAEAIDGGAAAALLDRWVEESQRQRSDSKG